MIYLQTFESQTAEDKFYQEITPDQYRAEILTKISWSLEDANRFKGRFPPKKYKIIMNMVGTGVSRIMIFYQNNFKGLILNIALLPDEWFLVNDLRYSMPEFYRCDGREGLIQYLVDHQFLPDSPLMIESLSPRYSLLSRREYLQGDHHESSWTLDDISRIRGCLNPLYSVLGSAGSVMLMIQKPLAKSFTAIIHKLEDEWFLVAHQDAGGSEIYYQCDQWDGLMQCLKDLEITQ